MALHAVPSAPRTPSPRARYAKPLDMIQCYRCGGREVIEAKVGVFLKAGKPTGGTKTLLCVCCLVRGERVVLA
jgi:hypothetical protein